MKHKTKGKTIITEEEGVTHVKEDYLTFWSISQSVDSRNFFWDIAEKDNNVYRFSTLFCIILRCYIELLIRSHSRKEVYELGETISFHIGFKKNNLNEIVVLRKPKKASKASFEQQKTKDFVDLAILVEKLKKQNGLGPFPEEIADFLKILKNPIGNMKYIRRHFALMSSKERIDILHKVVRNKDMDGYKPLMDAIRCSEKCYTAYMNGGTFWDKLVGVPFLYQNCVRSAATGGSAELPGKKRRREAAESGKVKVKSKASKRRREAAELGKAKVKSEGSNISESEGDKKYYKNTFEGLLTFMRNITAHAAQDSEGNVYGVSEIERKLYMHFPFYMYMLCTLMLQANLYNI